jgi:hypothetical protein
MTKPSRMRWAVAALALGALGCARTVYVHPTKSVQEFYADTSSCQAMGGQAGGIYDTYGLISARVYRECMYGKGWVPETH